MPRIGAHYFALSVFDQCCSYLEAIESAFGSDIDYAILAGRTSTTVSGTVSEHPPLTASSGWATSTATALRMRCGETIQPAAGAGRTSTTATPGMILAAPRSPTRWWLEDGSDTATLYEQCREQAEREASPSAAIIDSQSVKSAEKGGVCI